MAWDGDHSDGIIEVIKQYCEEDGFSIARWVREQFMRDSRDGTLVIS